MCGLAGMMGPDIRLDDNKMMKDLLYIAGLRGTDSTGLMVAGLRKKKFIDMDKAPINSGSFIAVDLKKTYPLIEDYTADLFMGHCRDATVGTVNWANAHPFSLDNIVAAHNGTLVDQKYRGKGTTDSEAMFRDMDKDGVMSVLENLSRSSAFAISVYHKETTRLTLARNAKRTLYIGLNLDRRVLYWSSEQEMLELAATRNKVKLKVYYLAADTVYTFDFNKQKIGDVVWWDNDKIEYKSKIWTAKPTGPAANIHPVDDPTHRVGFTEYSDSYFDSVFDNLKSTTASQSPVIYDTTGKVIAHIFDQSPHNVGSAVMEDDVPFAADDGPNYSAEGADPAMWWDDEATCCVCERHLNKEEIKEATYVRIQDADYYSCKECEDSVKQSAARQAERRRPALDETKTEVQTH